MKRCPKCRKNVKQPLHSKCGRCSNCCTCGEVKTLGGWSSLTMVQRYAHLAEGRAAQGIATMLAAAPSAAQEHPQNPPRRIAGAATTP